MLRPSVPPESHGLLAYVEEMNLRESARDGDCVDYIQFGQDDVIPFMTFKKSDRLCGARNGRERVAGGYAYDDPHGNLLVWVSLGGRRQTSNWPSISVVNLTLVVTSYQKDCTRPRSNFKRCGDRDKCIWKHYFCDRHFNCAKDVIPADEEGCNFDAADGGLEHTTLSPGEGGKKSGSGPDGMVITAILGVCSSAFFFISIFLVVRCRSGRKCCAAAANAGGGGDCEHQPRSIDALSRSRNVAEENVYLPLTTRTTTQRTNVQGTTNVHAVSVELPEEAPPAYDDLFPEGNADDYVGGGGAEERRVGVGAAAVGGGMSGESEDWETEEESR